MKYIVHGFKNQLTINLNFSINNVIRYARGRDHHREVQERETHVVWTVKIREDIQWRWYQWKTKKRKIKKRWMEEYRSFRSEPTIK